MKIQGDVGSKTTWQRFAFLHKAHQLFGLLLPGILLEIISCPPSKLKSQLLLEKAQQSFINIRTEKLSV